MVLGDGAQGRGGGEAVVMRLYWGCIFTFHVFCQVFGKEHYLHLRETTTLGHIIVVTVYAILKFHDWSLYNLFTLSSKKMRIFNLLLMVVPK